MEADKKIIQIIQALKQAESLLSEIGTTAGLSIIDHDLMLSRIRSLYEKILTLEPPVSHPGVTTVSQPSIDHETEQTRHTVADPVHQAMKEEKTPSVTRKDAAVAGSSSTGKITPSAELHPAKKESREQGITKEPEILADKYADGKRLIHQTIAESRQGKDLSSRLQTKPLKDIAKAIGLNDKFLFIKELFGGDTNLYESTLRRLNEASSMEEAMVLLKEFNWEMDEMPARKLVELAQRKFVGNETR